MRPICVISVSLSSGLGLMWAGLEVSDRSLAPKLFDQHANMITKYLHNITMQFYRKFGLVYYLLTQLTYSMASVPLPGYYFVCFTSILFFCAYD